MYSLSRRDSLRPSEIPEEIWNTIWSNFLDSVGTVWATFHRRVSELATEYSVAQKKIYSIDEIVNYQLRLAYGYLTGNLGNVFFMTTYLLLFILNP